MNLRKGHTLITLLALGAALPVWSQKSNQETNNVEEMYIYGEPGETDVATHLSLSIMETPQTVTTISRSQLDDFALTNINDVLDYSPGITVEEVETDRTYYTARGFDIVNFQYDGVGIPFISGLNLGQQDTAIYEKVEIVKGAAGLITGLANPSATINYVRKRPTDNLQVSSAITAGEWSERRIDGDVSGRMTPFAKGRLVLAYDESDSYLDRHSDETNLAYGVLEFDLTKTTSLTIGHTYDKSDSRGVLWGALPLLYSDGTQTEFDISTSTAPDWTFASSTQEQTFIEFKQDLGEKWKINAHFLQNQNDYDSALFYVYGAPDRTTGLGLFGWSSAYQRDEKQNNTELFLTGEFDLLGQDQQLVIGYSYSDTNLNEKSFSDLENGFPVLGSDWAEGNTPAMNFSSHDPATQASDIELTQKALYFATRLNLIENLSLLFGARQTELEQEGISYGGAAIADADEVVPYYGLTWELIDNLVLYGSYSEVFKQQTWVGEDLRPLGPTLGDSTELGLKKSLNDERATITFAHFSSDQDNFGEFIGRNDDGIAIYKGSTLSSSGFEIEFSGEVVDGLNIGAGYLDVKVEDDEGNEARPFIPSQLFKFSTTYRVPFSRALRFGGLVTWQDGTTTSNGTVRQDSYTLIDLAAHYELNSNLGISINIDNLTDEKYLSSLYWDQAFYGAPRNISASIRYTY